MQWLKFERLRWDKGKPETARYHCAACDVAIGEHAKTAMLQQGEWRATAAASDISTAGFHLSALYSPASTQVSPRMVLRKAFCDSSEP